MCWKMGCAVSKLNPIALGLACGITKALFLLLLAWTAIYGNYGLAVITQISEVYQGYSASFVGGLYGAAYGLLMGFVFGFIVALIYNLCLRCCHCSSCKKECACNKEACTCSKKM